MKKPLIIFFLPFAIFSLINIMFNLGFENILFLNPQLVQNQSQIWRIFTFPILDHSLISIMVVGITLYLYIPQLTRYFSKFHLGTLAFLLLLMQGAMQLLIFWGLDISFGGYSSFASFFMVLTVLLFPKAKLRNTEFPRLNNLNTILIFFVLYLTAGIEKMWNGESSDAIAFLFPILFGTALAFGVVLQIYIFKKYFLPKRQARSFAEIADLLTQARESMRQLETTLVDEPKGANQFQQERRGKYSVDLSEDPEENENHLNEILDKIIENGQESLTFEESQFLRKFSRNL